jgi:ER-bound oxygenase mpaB/B'/Rubber oxygenase, catalytic domain
VRMMHALVRHSASKSPKWRTEDWGLPINQTDMLGTNMLFSIVYLTGLRAMGMRFTREEADAIVHMWRYIGYLMGVDEALLPASEMEGRRIAYAMFRSQVGADEDSRRLAKALWHAPYAHAKTELQRKLIDLDVHYRNGLSRALLGDEIADELGLPKDLWKYAIALTTPPMFALETLRRNVPGLTDFAVRFGERSLVKLAARITAQEKVTFVPDVRGTAVRPSQHAHAAGAA